MIGAHIALFCGEQDLGGAPHAFQDAAGAISSPKRPKSADPLGPTSFPYARPRFRTVCLISAPLETRGSATF